MAAFFIPGIDSKAVAELKANLDANNAQFKASLGAAFKTPSKPQTATLDQTAKPKPSNGWGRVTEGRRGK